MTTTAVIMMLIAMATIWGGLALAIVNLTRRDSAAGAELHAERVHRDL